jgi:hypothetical protein
MHTHNDQWSADLIAPGQYKARCSCGGWEYERPVNPGDPGIRAEVDKAWTRHHLTALTEVVEEER